MTRPGAGPEYPARWDLPALVAPYGPDRFRAEIQGTAPAHLPGKDDRFSALFGWSALNQVLELSNVAYPTIRLLICGETLPAPRYTRPLSHYHRREVDPSRLLAELRRGASLVVESLDRLWGPIGEFNDQLERDLGDTVKVVCFASWSPDPALELHWDDGEVFALQIAGSKRWVLHPDDRPFPLMRDVVQHERPSGQPAAEFETTAGDVLYVPRGWWHAASTTDGPSLHVTFQVRCRTGIDLLVWLMDQVRAETEFRRTLPLHGTPAQRAAHAERLRDAFARYWTADVVQAYAEDVAARVQPRPTFGLPNISAADFAGALGLETLVRGRFPRALDAVVTDSGSCRVRVAERELTVHREAWVILQLLLPGSPWRLDALVEAARERGAPVTAEATGELLGDLYAMDLVEIAA